jgi:hypothetical protein
MAQLTVTTVRSALTRDTGVVRDRTRPRLDTIPGGRTGYLIMLNTLAASGTASPPAARDKV